MALVVSGNTTESAAWNTRRHRHTTRHACSVIIHTVTIQSDNEYEEPTQRRWLEGNRLQHEAGPTCRLVENVEGDVLKKHV